MNVDQNQECLAPYFKVPIPVMGKCLWLNKVPPGFQLGWKNVS